VWDTTEDLRPREEGWIENHETSGADHRIYCGLTQSNDIGSASTDDLWVYFYDNNSSSAMEGNVYCNIYTCNTSGSTCNNETTTFGNASGGTTISGSTFTGHGYIYFSNFDKPSWGIPNVWCAIPPDNGGAESMIEGFYMIY